MKAIELIIMVNSEGKIEEITCIKDINEWFEEKDWNICIGKSLDDCFKDIDIRKTIEIESKLFGVHKIPFEAKTLYFLSTDSAMKVLFEETLNKVTEGIQIYDRNGYFVFGNNASEELEGYKSDDFFGKHLLDLYDLTEDYSTTMTAIREKKTVKNRCDRFTRKDGVELLTINSSYPIIINKELAGAATFEGDMTLINNLRSKSFDLDAFIREDNTVIPGVQYNFKDIIHISEKMDKVIKFAKKIAVGNTSILITGETGTGKELFAQSIHNFSSRRSKPFIDINCSAVPDNLVESIFFGTEKGAFTGSGSKKGLIELADQGTLFLDEVNSMSLDMQAKLLRAVQQKRFRRVGGQEYIECDIRIIAASNVDLKELIEKNFFRRDFYYRISGLSLDIPPLSERQEDIVALSSFLLNQLSEEYGKRHIQIDSKVMSIFKKYKWPGNVRELRQVLEYAINRIPDHSTVINAKMLPDYIRSKNTVQINDFREAEELSDDMSLEAQIEIYEKQIILKSLENHYGNITRTAKSLGLSRQSLQYRLKKYKIE